MTQYLTVEGKRLAFTDRGEGDVIVLLHGYLESLLIWEDFSRELSRHFRVVSLDLPGHGLSETVTDIHSK
jgi:pimeloyl-ACP methyl ester carboxylesterase